MLVFYDNEILALVRRSSLNTSSTYIVSTWKMEIHKLDALQSRHCSIPDTYLRYKASM